MKHYDYIFTGSGLSALMTVYEMILSGKFNDKSILLLDENPKKSNDRTWCFWDEASTNAEALDTSPGAGDAGLHEEGGNTQKGADGSIQTVNWTPGVKKTGTNNASIPMFNGVATPSTGSLLDYWHVHTSGTVTVDNGDGTETSTKAIAGPSGMAQKDKKAPTLGDGPTDAGMQARGYKSTAIQVDTVTKTPMVNFYNGTKQTGTMTLSNFVKLW